MRRLNFTLARIKRNRGFTLVEVLVALVIGALIIGAASTIIYQLFTVNTVSNDRMMAVRQVQNAGYWISRDIQMTEQGAIILADDVGTIGITEVLRVSRDLTGYTGGSATFGKLVEVTYTLDGGILTREESHDGVAVSTIQISSNLISFSYSTIDYILQVSSNFGSITENRTYEIYPRPS
jgi:prepilin-type N-terminal cleavage/methylation domain-containing protein